MAKKEFNEEQVKNLYKFFTWCLQNSFEGCDIDGGDAQEEAIRLNLMNQTTYNPDKHGYTEYDIAEGDPWYTIKPLE